MDSLIINKLLDYVDETIQSKFTIAELIYISKYFPRRLPFRRKLSIIIELEGMSDWNSIEQLTQNGSLRIIGNRLIIHCQYSAFSRKVLRETFHHNLKQELNTLHTHKNVTNHDTILQCYINDYDKLTTNIELISYDFDYDESLFEPQINKNK